MIVSRVGTHKWTSGLEYARTLVDQGHTDFAAIFVPHGDTCEALIVEALTPVLRLSEFVLPQDHGDLLTFARYATRHKSDKARGKNNLALRTNLNLTED